MAKTYADGLREAADFLIGHSDHWGYLDDSDNVAKFAAAVMRLPECPTHDMHVVHDDYHTDCPCLICKEADHGQAQTR